MTEASPTGAEGRPGADASASGRPARSRILTINGGSSSVKFAVFERAEPPARLLSGRIEEVGRPGSRLVATEAGGRTLQDGPVDAPDQASAAALLGDWLRRRDEFDAVSAIGHRVVHGGPEFYRPERVTPRLIEALRAIGPYDPEHLPGEIALIEAFGRLAPGLPQVACFDTAFHHDLPRVARIVPIPRRFEAAGVRRYGFHGLSYTYLAEELARVAGPDAARGRVILAHLGSGASLAAVLDGHCLDTTMGFTPAAGLVMGTRSGDLDPGLAWFLARSEGISAEQFHRMVNHESGLLGVSETSPDLRDLLARQGDDPRAAEAVELFCYRARLAIGAFAAALGGLDTLVFSGGIGENSPEARGRICRGLEFLGLRIDPGANARGDARISAADGSVAVLALKTDEESIIARQTLAVRRGEA